MAVTLSITKAVELINNGYVRYRKNEVEADKSLQSFFNLNTEQMKNLLKRSELKSKKTTDNSLIFEEDLVLSPILVIEEEFDITEEPNLVVDTQALFN